MQRIDEHAAIGAIAGKFGEQESSLQSRPPDVSPAFVTRRLHYLLKMLENMHRN